MLANCNSDREEWVTFTFVLMFSESNIITSEHIQITGWKLTRWKWNSNVLTDAKVSNHPRRFSPSEKRSNPNFASSSSSGVRFSFRFLDALLSLRSRLRPSPLIVATRSKVLGVTLSNGSYESLGKVKNPLKLW